MQQSYFDKFSSGWWDKEGPMKMLHSMNETRMLFIQERILNRYQDLGSIGNIFKNPFTFNKLGQNLWNMFITNPLI